MARPTTNSTNRAVPLIFLVGLFLCTSACTTHAVTGGAAAPALLSATVSERDQKNQSSLPSSTSPVLARQRRKCLCPREKTNISIRDRFDRAYAVYRARVVSYKDNRKWTRRGNLPHYFFRTYKLKPSARFKRRGPKVGRRLIAQGFVRKLVCGLKLHTGMEYLFFFENRDPIRVPRDDIWKPEAFVFDKCLGIVQWRRLSKAQLRFMKRRAKY